jgi:hypothetical protein
MIEQVDRHLQRQPRLADAGQGEQADLLLQQQVLDRGHIMLASDGRCARQDEVIGQVRS